MSRNRNTFKDIKGCLEELNYALEGTTEQDDRLKIKKQLKLLNMVSDYVESCEWLVKADSKERMQYIIASNYDYKVVRANLELSEKELKNFMHYATKRLKTKIGSNTVDLIMTGKLNMAMVQFKSLTGTLSIDKLVRKDALDELPPLKFKPVSLTECEDEIRFLFDNSAEVLKKRVAGLDKDKMAFIRYILEEDTPKNTKLKYGLIKLLTGNGGSVEQYLERLQE